MKLTINYKVVAFVLTVLSIGLFFVINSAQSNFTLTDDVKETPTKLTSVDVNTFSEIINQDNITLIDIRTPEEFNNGKITGAILIDFYSTDFKQKLNELDKSKAYTIYCNSGNRSTQTLKILKDLGFTNVVELTGGIQAWMTSGKSVCSTC